MMHQTSLCIPTQIRLENKAFPPDIPANASKDGISEEHDMPTNIRTIRSGSIRHASWFGRLTAALVRPRRTLLDPRSLPDHLKRDMGFLDGNDPSGKGR